MSANSFFVLSEAVLVLVIVIEVPQKAMDLGIDYEHDYEHEHDGINWRAKPGTGHGGGTFI